MKVKMVKNKDFSGLKLTVIFILLITVKMQTINIFEQDKFHAQLSGAYKKF